MSEKRFSIADLLSIWSIKSIPKESYFNKLQVESNPVLTEVFKMTRTVPIVIDVKRMVQKYVGIDLKDWWGWSLQEMFGEGVKSYMNLIHLEDLVLHEQVNHLLFEVLADCSSEEKHKLKSILNFRFRKSNGEYVQIAQSNQILELDAEENIQTFVVLLQEINYVNDSPKCYIRFWGVQRHERLYEYRLANQELIKFGLPTKREKEIIGRLIAGQESQQIASQLFISKNTVDTHRRRILQKFYLKNTTELAHLVFVTHLLDAH